METKFRAFVIAAVGTIIPCLLAGSIVGLFFVTAFWYWTLGIAVLAFFYASLDRIPTRLFVGVMRGLPLGGLLKYGYASTDKRSAYYYPEDDWRYWFFYNSDHHKR